MKHFLLVLAIMTIFSPALVLAETPEGASDPAFQQAVEIWLADDDSASLPMLADLAGNGNTAAQILLGQIELHEVTPSRWVSSLTRPERRALFRAPGGIFGQSWLTVAATHSELARALFAARDSERMGEVIPDLAALGEIRAMAPAISHLVNHAKWERLVELERQGMLPSTHRYAAWYAALFVDGEDAERLRQQAAEAVALRDLQGLRFAAWVPDRLVVRDQSTTETFLQLIRCIALGERCELVPESIEGLGDGLLRAEETQQLAQVCRSLCPAEASQCAAAAWQLLHGYDSYLELGSPAATLIPVNRYERSNRAAGEILRRVAGNYRLSEYYQSKAAGSSCLRDQIQSIVAR